MNHFAGRSRNRSVRGTQLLRKPIIYCNAPVMFALLLIFYFFPLFKGILCSIIEPLVWISELLLNYIRD